jgi:hypothetical protein
MVESRAERRGCIPLIITAAVLLPLLYFLSSGPAYVQAEAGYLDGKTYRLIYSRMMKLSDLSPTFNQAWKQYLAFCVS